ncbi:hypothetical protein [Rugosimonospora africana]|uniref:hypothetical protein n=1 Tax=Rugosimonospora africana TaxID=556532 RepID=UPI0019452F06|nr:hypothetical protein [Rugosimonospora africana]
MLVELAGAGTAVLATFVSGYCGRGTGTADGKLWAMSDPIPAYEDEIDYLRQVELLAQEVVALAFDEGTLTHGPDPDDATPLQRAINALARKVRYYHFPGDGCLEERPLLPLSGIVVVGPDSMPPEWGIEYAQLCARLGVPARAEGWALWHAWDSKGLPHTLVTRHLATTRGILQNWSLGRDLYPVQPERAQVAAVVRGWIGPATLSPSHVETVGLGKALPTSGHDDSLSAAPEDRGKIV